MAVQNYVDVLICIRSSPQTLKISLNSSIVFMEVPYCKNAFVLLSPTTALSIVHTVSVNLCSDQLYMPFQKQPQIECCTQITVHR